MHRRNNGTFFKLIIVVLLTILCFLVYKSFSANDKNNTSNKKSDTEGNIKNTENDNKNEQSNKKDVDIQDNTNQEDDYKPNENEEIETSNEVNRRSMNINIELLGEEKVTIKKGTKYVDEGVKATYEDGSDASSEIIVENTVDTSKEGTYTVSYYVGNSIVIRRVTVE